MSIISKRFQFDGKPVFKLNELQLSSKKIFESNIISKEYVLENVSCVICNNSDFELLAEKDRFGLSVQTVICKKCGLLQINPRMNQESYNKFYDSIYRKLYDGTKIATDKDFNHQREHGKAILKFIEQSTKKKITNKFIVEIGTSTGGILQIFKDNNNEVYGLDLSSEYIEYGKNKGLNLHVGTVEQLEKVETKPDLVIYSHVLEHICNPVEELAKLRKYLKEDSLVYIEVPGVKNLYRSYDQDFLKYLQNAHVYNFSLESLKNLAQKSGYSLIHGNETINGLFQKSDINQTYNNDYVEANRFLRNLEKKRQNPFNLIRIKLFIKNFLVFLFEKMGTLNIVRKIYQSFKKKDI